MNRSKRSSAVPRPLTSAGRLVRGVVGVAAVVAALEALGRARLVEAGAFPPASEVLARAAGLAADPEFVSVHLRATLTAWALGLVLAVALAVPLGVLLGSLPVVDTATRAIVEFLRPIPSVALIPLVALILGTGLQMKVVLIVYAATWPILFNTMYGLLDAEPLAKDTLRAFGFGPLQVLWRVSLPAAAPFVYTGIRLSASVALILAVGSEILAGFGDGLGIFIGQAAGTTDGALDVLAGTVWAGCLGLLVNAALVWGERRLFGWRPRREPT